LLYVDMMFIINVVCPLTWSMRNKWNGETI